MITETQGRLLAHLLHEIRPDWGIDGTLKVLIKQGNHPARFGDIATAAITAARDPHTQTPARIFQVSLHWPEEAKRMLPRPPACEDHPELDGPTCRCCWADFKTGQRPQTHIGRHYTPTEPPESETA